MDLYEEINISFFLYVEELFGRFLKRKGLIYLLKFSSSIKIDIYLKEKKRWKVPYVISF